MKKKIKKNTVFVKTRTRLRQAEPQGESPAAAPRHKSERLFSESRDIREDRGIRQLKTTRTTTQRKGPRKTKVT